MPTYARSKTNGFFRFRSRHSYCPKDERSDNFLTPLTSKRKREAVTTSLFSCPLLLRKMRDYLASYVATVLRTTLQLGSMIPSRFAEDEGFKPPIPERGIPDFESSAFDHSANLPKSCSRPNIGFCEMRLQR